MTGYQHIEVAPQSGAIGAEISGVDLSAEIDDPTITEIRKALLEHLVIFFREQDLDATAQLEFSRRFGDLFVHPNFDVGQPNPEIVNLIREPGETSVAGEEWHTDTTMMSSPPMGAILYGIEVPPYGSDTLFSNQYLAYETLSDGMKKLLSGLTAVHSDIRVAGPQAAKNSRRTTKVREDESWKPTISHHPVVRTHPETGRQSLFVNAAYTTGFVGMTEDESAPLLNFLLEHGNQLQFTCRFAWKKGSVAFWDNRCTKHLALNDNNAHRRHMRRTQIAGEPVI